jgi:hypothetical protein
MKHLILALTVSLFAAGAQVLFRSRDRGAKVGQTGSLP